MKKDISVTIGLLCHDDYLLKLSCPDPIHRIMSFVDVLWGFEVTGGIDQKEALTVIGVRRSGLARRAGIRINDRITKINDTPATKLTLKEAQLLIRESGKYVRIYVTGDDDEESDDEFTVDFWFTPPTKAERDLLDWLNRLRANRNPGKWDGVFPWNDRLKPIYKESNCYMVPSKYEFSHTTTTTTTTTSKTEEIHQSKSSRLNITEQTDKTEAFNKNVAVSNNSSSTYKSYNDKCR